MAQMRRTDITGDRSRLPRFYEVIPLIFTASGAPASIWSPAQSTITFMENGVGDSVDLNYTFAAGTTKDEGLTNLLKGGYFSEDFNFALTNIGFEVVGPANTIVLTSGTVDLTTSTLAQQQNVEALTAQLWQAAMALSHLQYSEDGRTCQLLLGAPSQYPSAIGLNNSGVGPSNGFPVVANQQCFRRPLVVRPQNERGQGEIIQLVLDHPGDVPFDTSFAAPADGDDIALFVRVLYSGYLSDDDGNPIGDAVEQGLASQYAQSLGMTLEQVLNKS